MNLVLSVRSFTLGPCDSYSSACPVVAFAAHLLDRVPVVVVDGQPITLGELADIRLEESPPGIEHEAGRHRGA